MKTHKDGVYQRKGRKGFFISWRDASGKRRHRKTDAQTLQQARNALAAERLRVEQAKMLGFNPSGEETFSDVSTQYLKHQKARLSPKAYDRTRGVVEGQLNSAFSGKISAIRKADVERYVTRRLCDVSHGSVIRELGIVKHLLGFAVGKEIIPVNPAQSVKPPKAPAGRVRYLQPPELKHLLGLCPVWLQPVVALAVTTGMRRGEILNLRWLDVDLTNSTIWLPQTKNGEGRIVHLNQTAKAALESLVSCGDSPDGLVFGFDPDYTSQAFRKACEDAGIVDFRFHDLRHTAASWLRMTGADIHSVATLLGHKDIRMTARYSHLNPAFLGETIAKLDGAFDNLRCQGVASKKQLTDGATATVESKQLAAIV